MKKNSEGSQTYKITLEQDNADFETAIEATGYGKYNYLLLLVLIPGCLCSNFDTLSVGYLLPAAECDLNLRPIDKGILNAMCYIGMICSAYFWGFMADTMGRKKLLVWGYALDFFSNIFFSLSPYFWLMLVFKFTSGFAICGPIVILMSYIAEFNTSSNRPKMLLYTSTMMATASVILPPIAWWMIPQQWVLNLGFVSFNSWRIFVFFLFLPSFVSCIGFSYLDESPKFLMSCGRQEEALRIFRKMYSMNTGNPKEMYPVKSLLDESNSASAILTQTGSSMTYFEQMKAGFAQARALFRPPNLFYAVLCISLQFGAFMGFNTLRLWIPQIFASLDEYTHMLMSKNATAGSSTTLCEILNYHPNQTEQLLATGHCSMAMQQDSVYINAIIAGTAAAFSCILGRYLINIVGKKILIIGCFLLNGACGLGLYWGYNELTILAMSSLHIGVSAINVSAIMTVIVDLFPTSLRTMSVSITFMAGEIGAFAGNLLFPILLEMSCMVPFIVLGGIPLVLAFLSLLLPSATMKLQ